MHVKPITIRMQHYYIRSYTADARTWFFVMVPGTCRTKLVCEFAQTLSFPPPVRYQNLLLKFQGLTTSSKYVTHTFVFYFPYFLLCTSLITTTMAFSYGTFKSFIPAISQHTLLYFECLTWDMGSNDQHSWKISQKSLKQNSLGQNPRFLIYQICHVFFVKIFHLLQCYLFGCSIAILMLQKAIAMVLSFWKYLYFEPLVIIIMAAS